MPDARKKADRQQRVREHLESLVRCARNGSTCPRQYIQPLLERNPKIAREVGDLAKRSQKAWLDLLARSDLLLAEAAPFTLADLQKDLAKSKLEKLLVDRLFIDMIQLAVLDTKAADPAIPAPDAVDKRYHQAHARFLASIKTLAFLRKMAPQEDYSPAGKAVGKARRKSPGGKVEASAGNPQSASPVARNRLAALPENLGPSRN